METSTTHSCDLIAVIEDQNFQSLLQRHRERYLSWDDLLLMKLPSSLSAVETWRLLSGIRRGEGVHIPTLDGTDIGYRYTPTSQIGDYLSAIDRTCGSDSYLHRTISAASGRRFLVRSQIDEAIAAAQMDGLDIEEDTGEALLQLQLTARNDSEQVLSNMRHAMASLPEYLDQPFSPGLILELRSLLLCNVDHRSLQTTTPAMGLLDCDLLDSARRPPRQALIQRICDFCNQDIGDIHMHPSIRALSLVDRMRVGRVLPGMNVQVGRLMSQLYAMKHDLPVLGILPVVRARLLWERGACPYSLVSMNPEQYLKTRVHDPLDVTPGITLSLELAMKALELLQENVHRAEVRDANLVQALRADPSLNQRQRSILGRAMRNPGAEFRIAYHQTNHGISYPTARQDLTSLVNAGYLECGTRGKAFVFTPVPDLKTKIDAHDSERRAES